jgi:hypothetical protein
MHSEESSSDGGVEREEVRSGGLTPAAGLGRRGRGDAVGAAALPLPPSFKAVPAAAAAQGVCLLVDVINTTYV